MSALTSVTAAGPRPRARAQGAARWLTLGAVAGPVLFTLAWVVLGFLSPGFTIFGARIAPYSPISAGISGLGLGPTAPYMNAVFVLNGLLLLVGLVGIFQGIREMGAGARWTSALLLALVPLGSIMDGFFTLESRSPHYVGALLGFGSPALTFVIAGLLLRRVPRWRRFAIGLLVAGPLTLALLVLYFLTFSPTAAGAEHGVAGLTERLVVTESLAWFVALGWLAFRRQES